MALILNVIKGSTFLSNKTKKKIWKRFEHQEISNISVGIIGLGRIGTRVLKLLNKLPFKRIYANDIDTKRYEYFNTKIIYCSKDKLFKNADVISLHVPLTKQTKNLLNKKNLLKFKKGSCIVNTSRGEVINEKDLYNLLIKNYFSNIALDVTCKEPYSGPLLKFDNLMITPHNSSMSFQSRARMVNDTIKNISKFYKNAKKKRI